MRKIPSTMASQHPDHASKPYWHNKEFISTRHETHECYLAFSELGVDEYKWDWEGKYVDESVIERMFSEYFEYFKKNSLGKEKFLTFRLPNPKVQTEFRLSRAFMGILGAAQLAKQIGFHSPPIFEVILPMTESSIEMIATQEAFNEIASLKHPLHRISNGSLKNIEIIPLFEQIDTIIRSDDILKEYLYFFQAKFGKKPKYLRPYVARSDPALNAGIVSTVLAIKIALSHYGEFEKENNIKLFPIIGSASLPFRGGVSPLTIDQFINEYKGIKTILIQSAFRYDFPKADVISAIKKINTSLAKNKPVHIPYKDELELREITNIFELAYRSTVEGMADIINKVATLLPKRRERVLHIGLFGYSRGVGKVKLPRAIGFTGAMYSLGAPPELIGSGRGIKQMIKKGKIKLLEKYYLNIKDDLLRAGRYVNKDVVKQLAKTSVAWQEYLDDVREVEKYLKIELIPVTNEEKEHHKTVSEIFKNLNKKKNIENLLCQAAILRHSLG